MSTEFVGIELQLMGADGVRRDLEHLDKLLNSFRGKKKFDMGLNEARAQVVAFRGEIEKLQREQSQFKKGSDEWKSYASKIDEARQKLWNAQQAVREFGQASREAGKTFMQTFNAISSKVAHVGSAMQSFGNAMTNLTSPFRRLTSGIMMGAGFKVFNQFTEGIENSFTRADVMRKYPRVMEAMGYSADEAQASIDKLDASVQGLPTALDDIVGMSQRFTSTLGDLSKGTDLAIAANNAFLASMSTDTQKYQGMMQLQDVIGGKDMNAREWQALANSMLPAIRMMGESLGYEGEELKEYVARVQQGKVANEEFLDTLIKAGTSENGKIRQIALESLDTWEAFFSRIKTAASRLGYKGIIEPLNQLVETVTGGKFKSVNLLLDDFTINGIDKMQSSVKKWIKAHPQEITEFFRNLSQIKIGNFFRGYAKGLEIMIGLVEKLATALGKHPKLMGFLGGFLGMGGAIGRMSTIAGGLLKGTRHIWAGIGAAGSWILKGKLGGIFGRIVQIFGSKKSIQAAGDAAKSIPTVANTMRSAFKSLESLIKIGGAITIASGTAWFASTAVKGVLNDLKDIGNIIGSGDIDWNSAAKAMVGFGAYLSAFVGAAYVIGDVAKLTGGTAGLTTLKTEAILGAITALAFGIADLDMFFIKDTFKKFKEVTDYLNQSVENLRSLKNIKDIGDVKQRIGNVIDAMQQVYSSLKVQDDEGRSLMSASTQEMNAMQGIIGGMSNILGSINSISDSLKTLSKAKLISKENATKVGEKIGGIFEGLGEVFSSFLGTAFGDNPTEMTKDMSDTLTNFNSTFAILIGENGLFANLRKVQNDLRGIPGVQTIGSTLSNIKAWMTGEGGLFTQLKDIATESAKIGNAGDVETKMGNFATAFESLRVIFAKLKKINKLTAGYTGGDISGMSAVRNLIAQLESAFEGERVGRINSQISSFIEQVNSLLDAVKQINKTDGKINIKITLSDTITGKAKVISDIKDINSDVRAAVEAIKTYYHKNITVDVSANGTAHTMYSEPIGPARPAKGGMIYRAKGGSVGFPGRPIGTDRIPAWLSAGEFVHNKRAVSAFGIDFMRKVNNLDMKGAMNELMHRAGHMANINRGATITNNNYNNQKVVINNSNAGAGYTFKTASRFVGAF